ncbi:PspA/IM30 family protein [Glaciecola sp. 1036]|uniref:PspA/IM30 family protein n=1 Tax=Alteromonadaceae TaxID=72275 RepID=UPI003D08B988
MNIFSKLFSALKGGANEMGEAVVDANAIRIFEQEIREAKADLAKAKESEISLVASKKQNEAKITQLEKQIEEYESHASAALEKGDEALALETAGHIAKLESDKATTMESVSQFSSHCDKIRAQIVKTENQIKEMESQLSQVKATDSVHKAQQSIHSNLNSGSSSVASAKESLERIKEKQADFEAKQAAAEELETASSLDQKLKEAGIKTSGKSAEDVLAAIKAKKASAK